MLNIGKKCQKKKLENVIKENLEQILLKYNYYDKGFFFDGKTKSY